MTKPSDDSCRRINLPGGKEWNFIKEKRADRTAAKQIDFSRPGINGGRAGGGASAFNSGISQAEQSHGIAQAFPFPRGMYVRICIKLENIHGYAHARRVQHGECDDRS